MTTIDQIISIIKRTPGLTTTEIRERIGISQPQIRNGLTGLVKSRRVYKVIAGAKAHWFYGVEEKPTPTKAQPDRINKMTGRYHCPELRITPARPGAMDAYRIPSKGF
jgi:hypothetical protein